MWENKHPLCVSKTCLTSFPLQQNGSWALCPQYVPSRLLHRRVSFTTVVELFLCWSALCPPAGCVVSTVSAASGKSTRLFSHHEAPLHLSEHGTNWLWSSTHLQWSATSEQQGQQEHSHSDIWHLNITKALLKSVLGICCWAECCSVCESRLWSRYTNTTFLCKIKMHTSTQKSDWLNYEWSSRIKHHRTTLQSEFIVLLLLTMLKKTLRNIINIKLWSESASQIRQHHFTMDIKKISLLKTHLTNNNEPNWGTSERQSPSLFMCGRDRLCHVCLKRDALTRRWLN